MDPTEIELHANRFGMRQLEALEELSAIADGVGPGMPWATMCREFEGALDGYGDALGRVATDAERDLFIACARLSFYGVLTDLGNRRMWEAARREAISEIESERRANEAADYADFVNDYARENA